MPRSIATPQTYHVSGGKWRLLYAGWRRRAVFRAPGSTLCMASPLPEHKISSLCPVGYRVPHRITLLRPRTEVKVTGGIRHLGFRAPCESHGSATLPASAGPTKGNRTDNKHNQWELLLVLRFPQTVLLPSKKSFFTHSGLG